MSLEHFFCTSMLNIILFGPPGAGKGTQSERLLAHFGLIHLSTGDLLRAERTAGTELGIKADDFIKRGALVPDTVVIGMVRNKIASYDTPKGFIFDGFPRTIAQGEALDEMLKEFETSISLVLGLEVSEEELVKRLLLRGQSGGRADDQSEETIRKRFKVYLDETTPLVDFYKNQGKYQSIPGEGKMEVIFNHLVRSIQETL